MIKIKLSTATPEWPLLRQTPGSKGIWNNCRFILNQDVAECDFWVVYDTIIKPEKTLCPPKNSILITAEPPSIKKYNPKYIDQFATVITCHPDLKHRNVIHTQQALPWMVGGRFNTSCREWAPEFTKDYDELLSMELPPKDLLISVIVSNKGMTPGHHLRLKFVERLKQHFAERLDVYGAVGKDLPDKWDGIARYRYHVVLENSVYRDYWTEKLSDAFLAGALPFYYGCPNVLDYFTAGSMIPIDIREPMTAIATIERAIQENSFEMHRDAIRTSRSQVLNRYNIFPCIEDIIRNCSVGDKKIPIIIHPERPLRYTAKLRRFKNWVTGEGVR